MKDSVWISAWPDWLATVQVNQLPENLSLKID